MSFGGFQNSGPSQPINEINMIPLIDVMLVLLIIFIITAPLLTHAVKVDLPKASSHANITKPEHVQLAIRSTGEVFWNGERIDRQMLPQRLEEAARLEPQPELHIRADARAEYHQVAEVLSLAAKANLIRIGFVTDPGDGL